MMAPIGGFVSGTIITLTCISASGLLAADTTISRDRPTGEMCGRGHSDFPAQQRFTASGLLLYGTLGTYQDANVLLT